jgi:acetolactate synthase regulatory subunit
MMKRFVVSVSAAVVLAVAITQPGRAQGVTQDKTVQADKPTKQLSQQQQKMKDCAAKWKDEKAKTNVKGREAYRTFMGSCMKGQG